MWEKLKPRVAYRRAAWSFNSYLKAVAGIQLVFPIWLFGLQ
jgi:hypothetical protein